MWKKVEFFYCITSEMTKYFDFVCSLGVGSLHEQAELNKELVSYDLFLLDFNFNFFYCYKKNAL